MSLRFRKSIKIAKGIRLNVSKSGLGLSIGPRGSSVSIGPRGTYANLGLPGTGLSVREKISNSSNNTSSSVTHSLVEVKVKISIDDETGKETIIIQDLAGHPITDDTVLRKVKRTEAFKNKIEQMKLEVQSEIMRKTEVLVNIYQNSEPIITMDELQQKVENLQPKSYIHRVFSEKPPVLNDIKFDLIKEAQVNIKTWKFWQIKKMQSDYVNAKVQVVFENKNEQWKVKKTEFDNNETQIELEKNKQFLEEYQQERELIKKIISGDIQYVQEVFEDILSDIQLPLEFDVSFQVSNAKIEIDLDLPEIENFPKNKAEILQSGKLSIKKKTQLEELHDYSISVLGLAFYFASVAFNISPAIKDIIVSGYTQRVNKKTGNTEDQYIYQIFFDRDTFSKINVAAIDPLKAVENFTNKKDMSNKYEMREITL